MCKIGFIVSVEGKNNPHQLNQGNENNQILNLP